MFVQKLQGTSRRSPCGLPITYSSWCLVPRPIRWWVCSSTWRGSCGPPSYTMLMHFHTTNDFCRTLKCCVSFPVTITPDSPWHSLIPGITIPVNCTGCKRIGDSLISLWQNNNYFCWLKRNHLPQRKTQATVQKNVLISQVFSNVLETKMYFRKKLLLRLSRDTE